MALRSSVRTAIDTDLPEAVALYEQFHRSPELSMQETDTADAIAGWLSELGLMPQRFGGTGVVAVIENGPGPTVAYRADTDGLPIAEDTGLEYASTARGILPDGSPTAVMHGCGHDIHITVGLHLAKQLTEHRSLWSGTVVMLFQPGEETAQGARAMLDDDLWETVPKPAVVYGQHVWPSLAGHLYVVPGTAMAMSDCLKVTVHGQQAHGSRPEAAIDPIVLGAYMITRLQTVVSREIPGRQTAVVTAGTFHGGVKENIIPASAEFTLNIRTFDEGIRSQVLDAVARIIRGEAYASGAPEPEIAEMYCFPRCYNDAQLAHALIDGFTAELGDDRAHEAESVTGSEDFGAFGDAIDVPYVYWFLGGYSPQKFANDSTPPGNHSPYFAPDDVGLTLDAGIRAGLTAVFGHLGS